MTRLSSLRVRLFLLASFVILPMLAQMVYSVAQQRQVAEAEVIQETQRLTELIFGRQDEFTAGAHQFLAILAMLAEIRSPDFAMCSAFLAELAEQYPFYANIGVANPDGDVICSAVPTSEPINISDRPYFQRAIRQQDFAIGDYQVGRITSVASLNYGYPILDSVGQIQAVVFVALDLSWLNRLVQNLQLPSGATFKVIDENGVILAHYPDGGQWIGRSVPGEPLIEAALTQAPDSVFELPGLDGVRRLYAFGRISAAPGGGEIITIVGVPVEVAFAEGNRYQTRSLVLMGLALIIALVTAWVSSELFILRKVRAVLIEI
jgi:C4-dicarboxylate-specific signal transduction histidine kinase